MLVNEPREGGEVVFDVVKDVTEKAVKEKQPWTEGGEERPGPSRGREAEGGEERPGPSHSCLGCWS